MTPIDIRPDHLRIVREVLHRHLPARVKVWVFGSRASWTTKDSSDLDLALDGETEIPRRSLSALEVAFKDSDLPYTVDVVDLKRVGERFRRIVTKQRAPLPESFHEEIERDIAWPLLSLRQAGISLFDCDHRTPPPAKSGDHLYIAIPQIKDGRIELEGARRITHEHFEQWTRKARPEPYDVVLSRRCNPGETGYVPENLFFALGQNLVLLRSDGKKVFKPFLRWLVRSPQWWSQVNKYLNVGAVFDSLRCADIPDFRLSIPSLSEQRTIAHVLGVLDDKIELSRRMNATLEAMARALFQSWFVDFDPVRAKMGGRDTGLPKDLADLFPDRLVDSESGPIPDGWSLGTLDDIASLNPESWNTRNAPDEVAYVDLANTKWGHIETVEVHPWRTAPSRARRILRPGDTIVGTVRPGNGSYALVGDKGLTGSTAFAVLRPKTSNVREIVWCAATSRGNIDRLAHLADGGAYPAVRPHTVAETRIVLSDASVRRAFSSLTAGWFDRMESNKRTFRGLVALRDALLAPLVSGESRVRTSAA